MSSKAYLLARFCAWNGGRTVSGWREASPAAKNPVVLTKVEKEFPMSATMFDTRSGGVPRTAERSRIGPARLHGRILVADDSSDGRRTISGILQCMGLTVAVADNGHEAFQMALEAWHDGHPFDLVLMDTEMPELDGYQATALLRSAGYEGVIVALASCSFSGAHDRHVAAGCNGCASKPISYEMLLDTMQRHLPGSRNERAGTHPLKC
jgi:CheY-like chemotaxis protein